MISRYDLSLSNGWVIAPMRIVWIAILSPHTAVATDRALVFGGSTYMGLVWIMTLIVHRIDARLGSFSRLVMIIITYGVYPWMICEAVYPGFSFGYWTLRF